MNIDLHTHVKLSKKMGFNPAYFEEMMREAKAEGLHAIAATEHFNTTNFAEIYETLERNYPYRGDCYDIDGIRLFPGLEVDIRETGHILLIGGQEEIIELRMRLEPHTEKAHYVPFETLLDWADQYEVLTIGAHPLRPSTPLHHLPAELLGRLHAFDLNGKDLYSMGIEANRSAVEAMAGKLGRPVIGGSDTHQFLQYGSVMNVIARSCNTVRELRQAINEGAYELRISPCLETKVKSAALLKKQLKLAMTDIDWDGEPEEFAG